MKTVGIISLGCDKNLVDSENILGLLDHNNYQITSTIEDADYIIINTCGFIESSKKESIDTIMEMLQYNKPLIVTGCLVERYLTDLRREIPEVALFIPIRDYYRFNALLGTLDKELTSKEGVSDKHRVISTGQYSCYLKIGEGCSNCCTYCAIPLIRGPYRSRPLEDIISEAKNLAALGFKEITLLEQDTTKYGIDFKGKNITIVTLLQELLKIEGFEFIRLLYLYPDEISDELIDLIAKEERLTSYFDIPIQHSETHILTSMNRRGDKEYLRNLFSKIRNKIPNAILRTTLLMGFPGETSDDVDNVLSFIKEVQFDHLGAFSYSKEEGTKSFDFVDQIDDKEKDRRKNLVMKTQQSISYKRNKTHINEVMKAIVIGKEKDLYLVRTYWNAPDDIDGKIYVDSKGKELRDGDIVSIKITDAYVYDLMGEVI